MLQSSSLVRVDEPSSAKTYICITNDVLKLTFLCLPSHDAEEHVDERVLVPPPQVNEQDEDSLHDDQVGHDGVLHGSSFVRLDQPLLPKTQLARGVYLFGASSLSTKGFTWL